MLGGGYIALEFAGIFQRFGTEVHVVFRQPMPLRGFDEEVSCQSCSHELIRRGSCQSNFQRAVSGLACSSCDAVLTAAAIATAGLTSFWAVAHQTPPVFDALSACWRSAYAYFLLCMVCSAQVRKFANEQYTATGLTMHANNTPVEVRKQENGKLTIVIQDKEGNKTEITDNDQVRWAITALARCMYTGCVEVLASDVSVMRHDRHEGTVWHSPATAEGDAAAAWMGSLGCHWELAVQVSVTHV